MSNLDFQGQIAVVTGGAQGIGRAVAERLAESGARVCIWDRDWDRAQATSQEIGRETFAVCVDQSDWAAVENALRTTEAQVGPIDVLVNNAGIAGSNATVVDYDPIEWRAILAINLDGQFHCCKAILPGMIDRNYGRIVNVASIAGKEGNPNAAAYSTSKAGVIALTKSIGKETASYNIAVNCVTPAAARTAIFDQMRQEHIDYMLSKIPRGRFLEVSEAAAMIAFLCSADNSFSTGAVFDLSGGRATY